MLRLDVGLKKCLLQNGEDEMSKKARRRPSWKDGTQKRLMNNLNKARKQLYHNLQLNQDISPQFRRLCLEVLGVFPNRDD